MPAQRRGARKAVERLKAGETQAEADFSEGSTWGP
jgi:hypothetical protein